MNRFRSVAVAAAAITVIGLAGGPAGASSKPMSTARAARVYTGAVCPFNAVQEQFTAAVAAARAAGNPVATGSPVPADVKTKAAAVTAASVRAGRALRNPPAPWPADVREHMEIAVAYNSQVTNYYRAIAEATTVPDSTPLFKGMTEAQKVNLPLLRTALGVSATDPCAPATPTTTVGRSAAPTVGPVAGADLTNTTNSSDSWWIGGTELQQT